MRPSVWRLKRAFKHARLGLVPSLLAANGKEGERQCFAFRRLVEDFPIAQFAARAQRRIASADLAHGKSQGGGAVVETLDAFAVFNRLFLRPSSPICQLVGL